MTRTKSIEHFENHGMTPMHLEGWAVPRQGTSWDHTYIRSRRPLRQWACFDSLSGGKCICGGAIAIKEEPPQTGLMRYAVDGLCFQAANRILYQTGHSVCQANGYALPLLIFGVYGRGRWKRSTPINDQADDLELNRVLILKNVFLNTDELNALLAIRLDIKRSVSRLVFALDNSDLSKSRYLENFRLLTKLSVLKIVALIGLNRASRLFDGVNSDSDNIIDDDAIV